MRRTIRKCYVCSEADNPIVIVEQPIEERFGMAVLPANAYELVSCKRCATLYVNCDVTDQYLETLYRSESVAWQKSFLAQSGAATEAIGSSRLPEFRAHWRDIKQVRKPRMEDQLLDLGCQTGEFGSIAKADGIVPHGIELSKDYAQQALNAWGDVSTVSSEPLTATSFPGQCFAYVTAFETLEHMTDPRACLRLMRGLMATDGVIALSVPSTHYFRLKFSALQWLRRHPTLFQMLLGRHATIFTRQILPHTHLFNFSAYAIRLLLEQAGFSVVSVQATGWTDRSATLETLCKVIMRLSGGRYGMAPSLLAIARPSCSKH